MFFLKSESGAVAVDWVVVTAGVVGLGVSAVTVTRGGVQSLGQDVGNSLTGASVARLILNALPGGCASDFETNPGTIGVYASGDRTAGFEFSDVLGSVSGENAMVITSGSTRNGGGTFGGAYLRLNTDEIEAGGTYLISYWARTDGDAHSITLSNQSGRGDNSSLSHSQNLTGTWQQYTHEAVLDVERPVVYFWTQGANQTVAIDDLRYERID